MGEWFLFAGEFVKYHDLKDKDELIVYRDGVGKLVRAFFFEFFEFWRTRICFEVPIMSREGGGLWHGWSNLVALWKCRWFVPRNGRPLLRGQAPGVAHTATKARVRGRDLLKHWLAPTLLRPGQTWALHQLRCGWFSRILPSLVGRFISYSIWVIMHFGHDNMPMLLCHGSRTIVTVI